MLVLSRKPGERILIDGRIAITIVRIGPNNVRLGIEAPKELNIVRDELVPVNDPPTSQSTPEEQAPVIPTET